MKENPDNLDITLVLYFLLVHLHNLISTVLENVFYELISYLRYISLFYSSLTLRHTLQYLEDEGIEIKSNNLPNTTRENPLEILF